MPRWVPKVIALAFVGLGTFIILGWLLLRLRGLLIVLLVSLVLSFALEPVVNRLERRRVRRSVGTLISFIGALIVLGAFLFVMGRLVTTQVIDLIDRGPGYIQQSVTWIESTFNITDINVDKLLAEFNKGGMEEALGGKLRKFVSVLYVATMGRAQGIPLFDSLALLGRERTLQRLRTARATAEHAH